eukprot:UC4_evm1s715
MSTFSATTEAGKESKSKTRVFFDISVDGVVQGKIIMRLFSDIVPRTCENFRALCTGEKGNDPASGKPLSYEGCPFHRIIPGFMCQGEPVIVYLLSVFFAPEKGCKPNENFTLKHTDEGILSMANAGPNTNGSQFFLCTAKTSWLDGKHVVFGEVVRGMGLVKYMDSLGSQEGKTSKDVKIFKCGELSEDDEGNFASSDPEDPYEDWPESSSVADGNGQLEAVTKLKERGNAHFKSKDYEKATQSYSKAARYYDLDIEGKLIEDLNVVYASVLLNRAQCSLKLGQKESVISDTASVLNIKGLSTSNQVKALFRQAKAQGDEEAKNNLKTALALDPDNSAIKKELANIAKRDADRTKKEKATYKKMFG